LAPPAAPPATGAAPAVNVPVIAEADSLVLVGLGFGALALLVLGRRRWPTR
jgi:hypothetical protein